MQWFREWEAFVKGKDHGEWSRGSGTTPGSSQEGLGASGLLGVSRELEEGPQSLCLPSRFLVPPFR